MKLLEPIGIPPVTRPPEFLPLSNYTDSLVAADTEKGAKLFDFLFHTGKIAMICKFSVNIGRFLKSGLVRAANSVAPGAGEFVEATQLLGSTTRLENFDDWKIILKYFFGRSLSGKASVYSV